MQRAFFFIFLMFFSAFCFAQQNSDIKILGKIPDAGDQRLYQLQVGAFQICQNAEEAFAKLNSAALNPAYESFSGLIRVVINRLPAGDVPSYIQKIQNAGFIEVIVRIDTGRPAERTLVCPAGCDTSTCSCGSPACTAAEPPPAFEETAEETPAPAVPAVTRVRETVPVPQQSSLPLLPAPGNRHPEDGYIIGEEELRRQRGIDFSWDAVEGATAYILTIYRETPQGRRQIFITEPMEQTNYTLDNLDIFENTGTYVWRVEAISSTRRGRPGENGFMLDIPRPGPVTIRDTGVLYGNH
jgi:hypothetical protein